MKKGWSICQPSDRRNPPDSSRGRCPFIFLILNDGENGGLGRSRRRSGWLHSHLGLLMVELLLCTEHGFILLGWHFDRSRVGILRLRNLGFHFPRFRRVICNDKG